MEFITALNNTLTNNFITEWVTDPNGWIHQHRLYYVYIEMVASILVYLVLALLSVPRYSNIVHSNILTLILILNECCSACVIGILVNLPMLLVLILLVIILSGIFVAVSFYKYCKDVDRAVNWKAYIFFSCSAMILCGIRIFVAINFLNTPHIDTVMKLGVAITFVLSSFPFFATLLHKRISYINFCGGIKNFQVQYVICRDSVIFKTTLIYNNDSYTVTARRDRRLPDTDTFDSTENAINFFNANKRIILDNMKKITDQSGIDEYLFTLSSNDDYRNAIVTCFSEACLIASSKFYGRTIIQQCQESSQAFKSSPAILHLDHIIVQGQDFGLEFDDISVRIETSSLIQSRNMAMTMRRSILDKIHDDYTAHNLQPPMADFIRILRKEVYEAVQERGPLRAKALPYTMNISISCDTIAFCNALPKQFEVIDPFDQDSLNWTDRTLDRKCIASGFLDNYGKSGRITSIGRAITVSRFIKAALEAKKVDRPFIVIPDPRETADSLTIPLALGVNATSIRLLPLDDESSAVFKKLVFYCEI